MLKRIARAYFGKPKKTQIKKTERIVLIKSGAMGDVIMTTPLVRALRKGLPKSEITYVVGRQSSAVIEKNPNIDRIMTFDSHDALNKNLSRMFSFSRKLKKENFDVAFVLDKSYLAGIFARMAGIPVRIGFDRYGEGFANTHNIRYSKLMHEIDYYLSMLRFLRIKPRGRRIEVFLGKKDRKFAQDFFRKNNLRGKTVCIAASYTRDPGGIESTRSWPNESYASVINLLSPGINFILSGSKEDTKSAKSIQKLSDFKTYSAAGKTSVRGSMALMHKCDLVITHDAGPLHMAAAVGTPVITIFGPTDPRRKSPPGSVYLWKGSSCTRCEVIGTFPYCNKHPSTAEVSPQEVVEKVKMYLNKKRHIIP